MFPFSAVHTCSGTNSTSHLLYIVSFLKRVKGPGFEPGRSDPFSAEVKIRGYIYLYSLVSLHGAVLIYLSLGTLYFLFLLYSDNGLFRWY
jgi:hypothetical protein